MHTWACSQTRFQEHGKGHGHGQATRQGWSGHTGHGQGGETVPAACQNCSR